MCVCVRNCVYTYRVYVHACMHVCVCFRVCAHVMFSSSVCNNVFFFQVELQFYARSSVLRAPCMHTCGYACMRVYLHAYMWICMHTCGYACMRVYGAYLHDWLCLEL